MCSVRLTPGLRLEAYLLDLDRGMYSLQAVHARKTCGCGKLGDGNNVGKRQWNSRYTQLAKMRVLRPWVNRQYLPVALAYLRTYHLLCDRHMVRGGFISLPPTILVIVPYL